MTDGPDSRASDAPVGEGGRRRVSIPLAPGQQRRLLWRFMPAALAVVLVLSFIERQWRGVPPPASPQIDTALEAVRGPLPADEAVIIEATVEEAPATTVVTRSATDAALATVRDDAFFREADLQAWTQTWQTLRDAGPAGVAAAGVPRVSFAELFGQPRSFRGRLVRMRGTFRRIEHLPAPAGAGVEGYWQGWLEPDGGPASPIVVQFLELPAGMPTGLRVHATADVVGYFFKRYAYQATDTVRVAPLVMALRPGWRPPPPGPANGSTPMARIATALGVLLALVVAMWLWSRPAARRARRRVDVAESLAGFEPITADESLRRLAASHAVDAVVVPSGNPAEPTP